jgi:glutamate carboxypeptidase
VLPGAAIEVDGGPNRPPLEAAASAALLARARTLAVPLGLAEPVGAAVGGASDGNFTAGVGTPTLDGLGAVGGGAHADDEHVIVAELPGRTKLIAALVADLLVHP